MTNSSKNPDYTPRELVEERLAIPRITALWAFSESAFGGVLHALKIPFRGLFISSASVLFISLIALFTKSKREILRSTLIVILIKAVVSPHTPLAAYLAVSLQGVLGFLLFPAKKFYKLSALFLGILVLLFSGVQKIIILTILFGNTLWESLDIFIKQVTAEIFNIAYPELNYGYLIIAAYVFIHLIAGFFVGLYAGNLPQKINYYKNLITTSIINKVNEEFPSKIRSKKKRRLIRSTGIFIIVLSTSLIILSSLTDGLKESITASVLIMIVRSLVITFVWYVIVAPIIKKYFKKFVAGRKSEYSKDLDEIISMFPQFREIVNYCWKNSVHKRGLGRIRTFLSTTFYHLLLTK